jgi:hypothetical protein
MLEKSNKETGLISDSPKQLLGHYQHVENIWKLLRMPSSEMLHHAVHVRTDISQLCIASDIRVTSIGQL